MYRLVVFGSPTCSACPRAKEQAKRAAQGTGVVYEYVDISGDSDLPLKAGITSVPATTLFHGEQAIWTLPGVVSAGTLSKTISVTPKTNS